MRVHVGELDRAAKLSDSEPTTNRALAWFNDLSGLRCGMDGLPPTMREVHAMAANLRGCSMFGMRTNVRNVFAEPLEIVLSLESSKARMESPVEILASEAALYLALKNGPAEKGVDSRVTISDLDEEFSGFAFRLHMDVDKKRKLVTGSSERGMIELETVVGVRNH